MPRGYFYGKNNRANVYQNAFFITRHTHAQLITSYTKWTGAIYLIKNNGFLVVA